MDEQPTVSFTEMSTKIKNAQHLVDTFLNKVYFSISLVTFLPIVLYFSIQLAYIGKVGNYELPSFANIIVSILLLVADFSFLIVIFQDTDKKDKLFTFGSKKLKTYPNRLLVFYFCLVCIFAIVLVSDYSLYVLIGLNIAVGTYIWIQNPFQRFSLEHIDSLSKPVISTVCVLGIIAMSFFPNEVLIIPIIVISLLFMSLLFSIVRTIRVKLARAK